MDDVTRLRVAGPKKTSTSLSYPDSSFTFSVQPFLLISHRISRARKNKKGDMPISFKQTRKHTQLPTFSGLPREIGNSCVGFPVTLNDAPKARVFFLTEDIR